MSIPRYSVPERNIVFAAVVTGAIALLAAIVVFAALPNSTKFMHVLHKTGHPVVFGIIALLVLSLLTKLNSRAAKSKWIFYLAAFVIAVLIGALTEIAQLFTHRDATTADVMRDAVGATACLAFHAAIFGSRIAPRPAGMRLGLMSLGLLASIVALAPLIWCVAAYAGRDEKFPVILQDPSALDMYFVAADAGNVSVVKLPGNTARNTAPMNDVPALKVAVDKGQYPGVQITEPFPKWRGYQALAVDITNPGQIDLEIVIRVHDRQHDNEYDDRFNRSAIIAAKTRTTIVIPLRDVEHAPKRRLLNLDAVADINIFAVHAVVNGEFYVSKVWLQL